MGLREPICWGLGLSEFDDDHYAGMMGGRRRITVFLRG